MDIGTAIYAQCNGCDARHATPEACMAHAKETMAGSGFQRSHSWRVVNRTREQVIEHLVDIRIEDAIQRAFEEIEEDARRHGYSDAEIAEALRASPDFWDEWEKWCASDDR